MKKIKLIKGFTLIELLVVIAMITVLATLMIPLIQNGRIKAQNAAIVTTMSNLEKVIDLSKYPGTLTGLCNDFESGGEFHFIKIAIEEKGGIWNCDSLDTSFRIFAKLNQEVVVAQNDLIQHAFAQGTNSLQHSFGNFYCINSDLDKSFTHWSGDNLTYPSCNDADYISVPVDPAPTPEPTPDPDPEPIPPPAPSGTSCSGNKEPVCHFGNTLCVSSNAAKAHKKHGDPEGSC